MDQLEMTDTIVITSIYPPTEAVIQFAALINYQLIVVGDEKTPEDWSHGAIKFISIADQSKLTFKLARSLPRNHYSRKMIGYLTAIRDGARLIIDTDDDNIPKNDWHFPSLEGDFDTLDAPGFVNIYQLFTDQKIWPRGLPLKLISQQHILTDNIINKAVKVGVWQGLADEDPDVDAIYRLTSDTPCYFDERHPVVLAKNTISPFNSQNTLFRSELFALLYLPTFVTFRFTDILRGLVAQPIMWLYGYSLGFTNATVVQKRNPHDYMKDFISEIPMYQHCDSIISIVTSVIKKEFSIESNLLHAYQELQRHKIVSAEELVTLQDWIDDLQLLR